MPFFPKEKFEIETGMTREEVVSRLRNVTGERRFFKLRREKPFEGEIADNGFRIRYVGFAKAISTAIQEIIGSRWVGENGTNEQTLDISGEFEKKENSTVVSLKVTPILFLKIFLIAWIVLLFIPIVMVFTLFISGEGPDLLFFCIPVAMILIAFYGQRIIFKRAVRNIMPLLMAILQKQDGEG